MKFSIIIPTYNEDKVLERTLRQYQKARKSKRAELIIADGGSTDNTLTVAKRYADKIAVKKQSGPETIAMGRNRGAKLAIGEILIFFDADVIVSNLERLLADVEREFKNIKVVAGTSKVLPYPEERTTFDTMFHTAFWWFICLRNNFGGGAARGECQIIRRSAFAKLGGYQSALGAGEDFELYNRLAKLGKVINFKVMVFESPRRYRKLGYRKVAFAWFKNFVRASSGQPVPKWKAVR